MRALVMGGTGSIGLHLVHELLQQPSVQHVTLLSRRQLPQYADEPKVVRASFAILSRLMS